MVDHQKALTYFQNLFILAAGDGILAEDEKSFLMQVAEMMGLGIRETTEIMMNRLNLNLVIPDSEEERKTQLEDVVLMMLVDRKIHENEYNLCLKFAHELGLEKEDLDKIIIEVIKS